MNIKIETGWIALALAFVLSVKGQTQNTNLPIDIPLGNNWHFSPMVRHDWTDILNNGGEALAQAGNIQGATFSFSDNPSSHADSWSAVGSVIGSFAYRPTSITNGLNITEFALGPTVAANQISNGSNTTNSVDNLYFGLGQGASFLYSKADSPYQDFAVGLAERAAFVYDTDTAFKASLPGGIFELEPQFLINNGSHSPNIPNIAFGWPMGFGRLASGDAAVILQLRSWFHLEGGDIQESGTNWGVVKGSFLRLGPEVRAQMTFPGLDNLGISGEYDYIPTLSGPSGENYLYKLGLSVPLAFLSNTSAKSPPISLSVNYIKGGLTLNKQAVNALTVGISVLF